MLWTAQRAANTAARAGVMTIGDQIFMKLDAGGSKPCPVCKAKGYVLCESCRGTGARAVWLPTDKQGSVQ